MNFQKVSTVIILIVWCLRKVLICKVYCLFVNIVCCSLLRLGGASSFSCRGLRTQRDIDSSFKQQKMQCVHSNLLIESFSFSTIKSILTQWHSSLLGWICKESYKVDTHLTSLFMSCGETIWNRTKYGKRQTTFWRFLPLQFMQTGFSSLHVLVFHLCFFSPTGKPRVELSYDKMYTVTSRLTFTVNREDDGMPVVCIVDHPAVKDFQAQKYLEVQCKWREKLSLSCFSFSPTIYFSPKHLISP